MRQGSNILDKIRSLASWLTSTKPAASMERAIAKCCNCIKSRVTTHHAFRKQKMKVRFGTCGVKQALGESAALTKIMQCREIGRVEENKQPEDQKGSHDNLNCPGCNVQTTCPLGHLPVQDCSSPESDHDDQKTPDDLVSEGALGGISRRLARYRAVEDRGGEVYITTETVSCSPVQGVTIGMRFLKSHAELGF